MAGSNKTFLTNPHFEHPDGASAPRAREHAQHAANHARPHGVDPRVGAPKNDHFAPLNKSMTRQQRDMAGVGGLGHAVQTQDGGHAVSTSKNILEHAYNEDTLNSGVPHPKVCAIPNYPGMRSRTNSKHPGDAAAPDPNAVRRLA